MTKVYLAHSISTRGEFEDSKRVAGLIRDIGYDVYAAAENASINDKSRDPTPLDIYEGDVSEILECDIFVINLSGGLQDGTISELGVVAGINEITQHPEHDPIPLPVIAYTSNARLLQPQHYAGMASASVNHLVLGMVDMWGVFSGDESGMLAELIRRKS